MLVGNKMCSVVHTQPLQTSVEGSACSGIKTEKSSCEFFWDLCAVRVAKDVMM